MYISFGVLFLSVAAYYGSVPQQPTGHTQSESTSSFSSSTTTIGSDADASAGSCKKPDPTLSHVDWSTVPALNGITIELCAGIIDNPNLTSVEIAKQEVWEECGYNAPLESFKHVAKFMSVGESGERQWMFYIEVTDEMKLGKGGGNESEGEYIEVIEMSVPEMRKYVEQEAVQSPSSLLFGIYWFLLNFGHKYGK